MSSSALAISVSVLLACIHFNGDVAATSQDDSVIVQTESGKVRGKLLLDGDAKPFRAFRGIPYAKAPTGDLRFKPSVPVEPWNGILDAGTDGAECPQPQLDNAELFEGDEDCLFLNVYTPRIKNDDYREPLPVLVFFHGGGFYFGTGNSIIYGAEKYMEVDVVLVTLNYRLGILGFMSTEDENSPGNYGLFDMVQALHWVQDNIAHFGGDSSKVTIFGESAGGVSVVYLMLSPLAKGLFHAAIAQSGTPLASWSYQKTPLLWTERVARQLGCSTVNTSVIVQCLKSSSVHSILRATEKLRIALMFPMFLSPVVDSRFIEDDPLALLREGRIASKVPFITGVVRDEGIAFYMLMVNAHAFKTKGREFLDGGEFATKFLSILAPDIQPRMQSVVSRVVGEYFSTEDVNDPLAFQKTFTTLLGDTMFYVGADVVLRLMSRAGVPTYAYLYTHKSPLGMVTSGVFGKPQGDFIGHADELSIEFQFCPVPRKNAVYVPDTKMSKLMNTLWRNFAETREPSFDGLSIDGMPLKWLSYDKYKPTYLNLSLTPSMQTGIFSNRTCFWTEQIPQLVQKYLADEKGKEEL